MFSKFLHNESSSMCYVYNNDNDRNNNCGNFFDAIKEICC